MMAQTKSLGWGRRPGQDMKRMTSEALDRVGHAGFKGSPMGQLSGGQQLCAPSYISGLT